MTDQLTLFYINATHEGGWLSDDEWSGLLVPWLLRECVPRADGSWWITHAVELTGRAR
jgi:hypothetical protein